MRSDERDEIAFGAEHIVEISQPPREYVLEKYGPGFFDEIERPKSYSDDDP